MAVSKEKLASIIENARVLCNPQADKIINSYKTNNTLNDPDPSSFNDDWDSLYMSSSKRKINENNLSYTDADVRRSNLPQHIKESLIKDKIAFTDNTSILDNINVEQKRKLVKEEEVKPQNNYCNTSSNNIDYSIIKAIFNECLKEYFDNKQSLNESTSLQTIGLQNGNISLVDNKGNIYKAKLEKIGNKNDKK